MTPESQKSSSNELNQTQHKYFFSEAFDGEKDLSIVLQSNHHLIHLRFPKSLCGFRSRLAGLVKTKQVSAASISSLG